jgi:hypothetical protein
MSIANGSRNSIKSKHNINYKTHKNVYKINRKGLMWTDNPSNERRVLNSTPTLHGI